MAGKVKKKIEGKWDHRIRSHIFTWNRLSPSLPSDIIKSLIRQFRYEKGFTKRWAQLGVWDALMDAKFWIQQDATSTNVIMKTKYANGKYGQPVECRSFVFFSSNAKEVQFFFNQHQVHSKWKVIDSVWWFSWIYPLWCRVVVYRMWWEYLFCGAKAVKQVETSGLLVWYGVLCSG